MSNLLYDSNTTIGRLFHYFQTYFLGVSTPAAHTLILFLISMIALESADSVRFIYTHFMSRIFGKSLNALYYAFSYAKVDHMAFLPINVRLALGCIPSDLSTQPVFICIDDTMVEKFGKHFDNVSTLFDHAAHNGSNFDGYTDGAELLLRIILNKPNIRVKSVKTQRRMKNLLGRNVCLDIDADDDTGKEYNVEVQRADKGADRKRARYHSSILDALM